MKLTEINLNKLERKIIGIISNDIKLITPQIPVIYLEGGHYDPRYPVTEFSVTSLHHALNIANNAIINHKKNLKISLGVLVDDLGLQCGADYCDISPLPENIINEEESTGELPLSLEGILAKYTIVKRERVIVQGERNCKNRGIQTLRRTLNQHNKTPFPELDIEEESGTQASKIFFINEDGQRIVLSESKSKDVWIAKCPLIMAQHYSDVYHRVSRLHPQTHSVHIIDFSETDDYNKVINGADVAIKLFLAKEQTANREVKITNVFLSPYEEEDYIIHSTSNKVEALETEV
ncbi:hypothetical protein [Serratia oryzae]|uniref:Uncharacterized protein n=1 Tax=Serratia oryzae TaxID=2034155 RepID=A0A1S8CM23_9GAMM|nr:hypothetical protein [Serratia oryzae]OMQ24494.1 hypothetical protein BMI79_06580 [Serratia oryzae]